MVNKNMVNKLKTKRNLVFIEGTLISLLISILIFTLIQFVLFLYSEYSLEVFVLNITFYSTIIPLIIFFSTVRYFIIVISTDDHNLISDDFFNKIINELNITEDELKIYFKKNNKVDLDIKDKNFEETEKHIIKQYFKTYEKYNVFNVLSLVKLNNFFNK